MKSGSTKFETFGEPDRIALTDRSISKNGTVKVAFTFPPSHHFNPAARPIAQYRLSASGEKRASEKFHPNVTKDSIEFRVDDVSLANADRIEISLTYYYCRDDDRGQCKIGSLVIDSSLQSGNQPTALTYTVKN